MFCFVMVVLSHLEDECGFFSHICSEFLYWHSGYIPMASGFPSQRASNASNVSISWRHHIEGNKYPSMQLDPPWHVCENFFIAT